MSINPAERVEQKNPIVPTLPQKAGKSTPSELLLPALEAIAAASSTPFKSCPTKKKVFVVPKEGLDIDEGLYHRTCLAMAKKGDVIHMTLVGMNYYHGECVEENPAEAEKWLRAAAKKGSSKAMAHLAELFTDGRGDIQPDPKQGFDWYKQAAEHEKDPDPVAMTQLGSYYEKGELVEKDLKYAEKLYKKAALPPYEHPSAAAHLAILYANNEEWKDSKEAVKWFHIAAKLKQPVAMYHLGLALARGTHIQKDIPEARKWLTLAAKCEVTGPAAMFELGNLSCQEKNYPLAILWFTKAASMKFTEAKHSLGCLYHLTEEIRDIPKAIKWYAEADEDGDLRGTNNLGVLLYMHKLDDTRAAKLFAKAAERGHVTCMANLGECFYMGRGVIQDQAEAFKWLKAAAEKDKSPAMVLLGRLHLEFPDFYDETKSTEWFRKAAKLNNSEAMHYLASAFAKGRGTEINLQKALRWERKAAQRGQPDVQHSLGNLYAETGHFEQAAKCFLQEAEKDHVAAMYDFAYCCEKGLGVPLDILEAIKWYRQAALAGDTDAMCKLGTLFSSLKDYPKAVKWLIPAAEKNHEGANDALVNLFKTTDCGPEITAMDWLKVVAQMDEDSEAFLKLGELFLKTQDYSRAIEWLTKAANMKSEKAIRILSEIYTTVAGFKDDNLAIKWLIEMFFHGDKTVSYKIATLLFAQKSEIEAARWLREAASTGNVAAMRDLVKLYSENASNKDPQKFLFWLTQTANAGDLEAMYKLSQEQAKLGKEKEAFSWLEKAAGSGHLLALAEYNKRKDSLPSANPPISIIKLISLAQSYLAGAGTYEENEQAVAMLQSVIKQETKATILEAREASYLLGQMHEKGVGVLKNRHLAKSYYHHAVKRGHLQALDALADLFPGNPRERWHSMLGYRIDHFHEHKMPS